MDKVHLHINVVAAFLSFLEWLLIVIPIKFIAAQYEGRSALASGVLNVL